MAVPDKFFVQRLPSLDELAVKYGTDKGSTDHNYCPHYEQYLARRRHDALTLLELGVWKGASLQMWREYFPNATIVGLDNNVRSLGVAGIQTVLAEQDDAVQLGLLAEMYGQFDVIVDDASHISSKTIASFRLLWPHLAAGGLYVVEDLQTSYDQDNYGPAEASRNPDNPSIHSAMKFCKRLADEANSSLFPEQYRLGYNIASVQFFPNICFIVKAG